MKFAYACTIVVALLVSSAAGADDLPGSAAAVTSSSSALPAGASALPSAPPVMIKPKKLSASTHRFFDVKNSVPLGLVAVGISADVVSTQNGLAYPNFAEMNPVARPFVQSRPGAAVYGAGSFGVIAGAMYIAHKRNHHKVERVIPYAVAGFEGFLSYRNYRLLDKK